MLFHKNGKMRRIPQVEKREECVVRVIMIVITVSLCVSSDIPCYVNEDSGLASEC